MNGLEKRANRANAAIDEGISQLRGGATIGVPAGFAAGTAYGLEGATLGSAAGALTGGYAGGRQGTIGGAILGEKDEDGSDVAYSTMAGGLGNLVVQSPELISEYDGMKDLLESTGIHAAAGGALGGTSKAVDKFLYQ